jgi:ankyrin repeat protein
MSGLTEKKPKERCEKKKKGSKEDFTKEEHKLRRLQTSLQRAKKQLKKLKKLTSAAKYASVPPHVQEKDLQKLRTLETEIQHLEEATNPSETDPMHTAAPGQLQGSAWVRAAILEGAKNAGNQVVCLGAPGVKRVSPKVESAYDEASGLYCTQAGNFERLRQLVEHEGWNTQVVDRHGTNGLMWAAGGGHLNICKYLTHRTEDGIGGSIGGRLEIESRNKDGRTPLMWALRNGQFEVVKWLVSAGADMHTTNTSGTNMLHFAIWGGHIPAIQWILDNSALDPRTRNYFGCTAAHWCAARGDVELCQWFHRAGLPFNTVNKGGHSPLHKAAWHGQENIVYWLVDGVRLGHTIHRRDWNGRSVIDLAAMNGHTLLATWLRTRWEQYIRRDLIQRALILSRA